MTKRMLIDASHAEETRVVMLDGNRLEEYDVETATKKQLKGNIYLAKIVRVEPSLQAAFVEYGGNRHGFLAFGEIHPDYYQIPVADRQRLIAMQEEEAEAERAAEEAGEPYGESGQADAGQRFEMPPEQAHGAAEPLAASDGPAEPAQALAMPAEPSRDGEPEAAPAFELTSEAPETGMPEGGASEPPAAQPAVTEIETQAERPPETQAEFGHDADAEMPEPPPKPAPEMIGGQSDGGHDREATRTSQRLMRHYKIQEVIRRRQVILVQVVKEERGTKGAALTTYISLAGRYCVLMPNSPRGGGVSRKITSAADRKRLKDITAELDIPKGMAMIVRTAGAQRPRPEIKRDCEYLLRLWDDIRDTTLASMAPSLIYEEASLIKRAIRDVYSSDVEEILVDGEEGWRAARGFMRMLMPTHARKVQLWREGQPLFARNNVEGFLDAMMNPSVQLRSGGYLVINQTEALVAIDVNSGRSTRERGIEETAVRTNLEAADEVARQLRLRDLAGLIVIDFIDMESRKHNAMVERRLKDALRQDRARIQVGSISHFGLMEMSRQRLRPSLVENSFVHCEHCNGTGLVRGIESASLHVLRAIEAAGGPRDAAEIAVHVAPSIALYILNHKRDWLGEIEQRCVMQVTFETDGSLRPPNHRIIKTQVRSPADIPVEAPSRPPVVDVEPEPEVVEEAESVEPVAAAALAIAEDAPPAVAETAEEQERKRKRRRRRRRGERKDDAVDASAPEADAAAGEDAPEEAGDEVAAEQVTEPAAEGAEATVPAAGDGSGEAPAGRSRRGRRSGRRRRRDDEAGEEAPPTVQSAYAGPTPADPFSGAFDIFDALERTEDQYVVNMSASAASFEHPAEPAAAVPEPTIEAAPEPVEFGEPEAVEVAPARHDHIEPVPVEPVPVEPVAEPREHGEAAVPEAHEQAEPAPAEPEPEPEPLIKPILVGAGEPAARRSGWWRR